MDVMKSKRNKTLKIVDGFKFQFCKLLNNDIHCMVLHSSFKDHNHLQNSEQINNRQKLNSNLKSKAVNDMFTRPSKIIYSELKYVDAESLTS
ncbi:Uncharacterized protein FWK35_00015014 [Aphis craccivora]|uniref:Uncharacterized protein n=1 Tax=Aphis craccivora TaxID=307492 RepID=A0A6G0YUX3_APHCR|nr:Uncharacterized protein FWK35_00015014 [Aphis craccivora]